MIKKLLFTALLMKMAAVGIAQRGMLDNAIGLRLGLGSGVTYQHFFSDHRVFEAIAYQRYGAVNLTLLAEGHQQMFDIRGLKWYYGAGGHVWVFNKSSVLHETPLHDNYYALGVDGILGMAFYSRSFPIQVSVDWKPAFNLKGSSYMEWDSGGISVRYRF